MAPGNAEGAEEKPGPRDGFDLRGVGVSGDAGKTKPRLVGEPWQDKTTLRTRRRLRTTKSCSSCGSSRIFVSSARNARKAQVPSMGSSDSTADVSSAAARFRWYLYICGAQPTKRARTLEITATAVARLCLLGAAVSHSQRPSSRRLILSRAVLR